MTEAVMTAEDHATAWLYGAFGYYVGRESYNECCAHVRLHTGCSIEESQLATSRMIKKWGKAPHKFTPPFWPVFRSHDIAVGDIVHGGRTVVDEHCPMSGRVLRIEKWYASGEPHYSVYIWTSFEGAEFEDDIALSSIYQVDKASVGEQVEVEWGV